MSKTREIGFFRQRVRWFKFRLIERGLWIGDWFDQIAAYGGWMKFRSRLYARVIREDGSVKELGLIGDKGVTTEFCEDIVDNLIAEVSTFGDYFHHVSGTGSGAEDNGDTASTFTSPEPNPLDPGTQVEASSVIYRSIATVAYVGTKIIREHGLLNNTTLLSGTLMDRTVFAAINVDNGDSIQFTYELTCTAGG